MGLWAGPEWATFATEVWQLLSTDLTHAVSRSYCGNCTRGETRPLILRLKLIFMWLSTRLYSLQWSRQLPRAAYCWDDKSTCLCCLIHPCELIQEDQLCAAAGVTKGGGLAGVERQPCDNLLSCSNHCFYLFHPITNRSLFNSPCVALQHSFSSLIPPCLLTVA